MADKSQTSEPIIKEALERFRDSQDATEFNRRAAEEDIRFSRLGEQWPENIKKLRQQEGRPCLTINRMPAFIRQVVNDARQNKPGIVVGPVDNGADKDTAEVIGGLIRSIWRSGGDVATDTAIDHAVSGGFGFFRISIDYCHEDSFDMECRINRVPSPLMVHWDANSTEFDASDWEYAFVSDWLTDEQFEARYPGKAKLSFEALGDREEVNNWRDDDLNRVAEYWLRTEKTRKLLLLSNGMAVREDEYKTVKPVFEAEGVTVVKERTVKYYEVARRIISGADVLEEDEWPGQSIPICPVWGDEVIIDGRRHFRSMIRDARDPQTMFNFWRSASTELVALAPRAPWVGPKGFIPKGQEEKWQTANTRSHAYLEFEGAAAPQRQPFAGIPAGAIQEALNAADDMKAIIGIYDPSLGARSNETSGRAIMARQREADVSNFHFIDNLSRAIKYAGRVLVEIIPSVYSQRQTIRILGDDMAEKVVKLASQPQGQQSASFTPPQEQAGQQESKLYDLSVGKYDVTVKTGPSYATAREETRETLIEIISRVEGSAQLLGDVLIEHMDFPGAQKVADRLKMLLPPAIQQKEGIQGVQPPQPQVNPLEQEERKAKIESLRAGAIASLAKAQATQNDQQIAVFEAILAALQTNDANPGASSMPPGSPAGQPQTAVAA